MAGSSRVSSSADSVFHGIQGVLGSRQESLIQIPEVISFDSFGLFRDYGVNMFLQWIGDNSLEKIIYSSFDLNILGYQEISSGFNKVFLHLNETVKSEGFTVLRKHHKGHFTDTFKVIFNSIFNDIIDVDDELLKFF